MALPSLTQEQKADLGAQGLSPSKFGRFFLSAQGPSPSNFMNAVFKGYQIYI